MNYKLMEAINMVLNSPFEVVASCGDYEIFCNEKDIIIAYKRYYTRTIQKFGEGFNFGAFGQAQLLGAPDHGWKISLVAEEVNVKKATRDFEEGATVLFIDHDGKPSLFSKEIEDAASNTLYPGVFMDSIDEFEQNGKVYVFTDSYSV